MNEHEAKDLANMVEISVLKNSIPKYTFWTVVLLFSGALAWSITTSVNARRDIVIDQKEDMKIVTAELKSISSGLSELNGYLKGYDVKIKRPTTYLE